MNIEPSIKELLGKIEKAGFEVAAVGGAVREQLLKKPITGWDLTTNATPDELLKIFPEAHYTNRFGTVLVPIGNQRIGEIRESEKSEDRRVRGSEGQKVTGIVEVTTYRTETTYSDSRHPDEVSWGKTLEEDLARRDFTINAIAFRYINGKFEDDPVDLYEGQSDLKKKLIRAVGDANERFGEDALRMMRAVRFATVLGFGVEDETLKALKNNAGKLSNVSGERIREELFKIVASENVDQGMLLFRDTGLLEIFMPELNVCFDVEQVSPKRHHIFDVGTHCIMSAKHCPSTDVIVRFASMMHDIGKAKVAKVTEEGVRTFYNHEVAGSRIANDICGRLHLSRDQKEKIFKLVRWHQFSVGEDQTDAAVRRFITNVGLGNVEDMIAVRIGDRLGSGLTDSEGWRLKLFRQRIKDVLKKPFTVRDLKIDGRDVMRELKIKPGRKVGEILDELFKEVLEDDKKNEKEYLLKRVQELKIES